MTLRIPERNHKNSGFEKAVCPQHFDRAKNNRDNYENKWEATAKMGSLTCDLCDTYSLLSLFESDDF